MASVKVGEGDIGEFMLEMAKAQGIGCVTTKDGHVLLFTKQHLLSVLEKMESTGQDKAIVFIKRPDMAG